MLKAAVHTQVTRWSAQVTRVGVVYVNVRVSKHLKEELAWAIDKQLWLIINIQNVIPIRI